MQCSVKPFNLLKLSSSSCSTTQQVPKIGFGLQGRLPILALLWCAVSPLDRQVLSSVLSAYGSKLLGEKQASEASMTIRNTLCAAAAAHNYHRPQVCA
jgi:hypothetical protein